MRRGAVAKIVRVLICQHRKKEEEQKEEQEKRQERWQGRRKERLRGGQSRRWSRWICSSCPQERRTRSATAARGTRCDGSDSGCEFLK